MPERIGTLKRIRRYPVKSMMGEDLSEAHISYTGIPGDRSFAFIDNRNEDKSFPWMTARQSHEMLLFKPKFQSSLSEVRVETPEGEKYDASSPAFETYLERRFRRELSLKYDKKGLFDDKPISIFSLQTLGKLSGEVGIDLQQERFRANFYVDWSNGKPFYEDELVGKDLELGEEVRVRIDKKDSRCAIPTINPINAKDSPALLRNIKERHDGCAGVYAIVTQEGTVHVDDPIQINWVS